MGQIIDSETIKQLNNDELQRLSNAAWFSADTRLSWLCQSEIMRRSREAKREVKL